MQIGPASSRRERRNSYDAGDGDNGGGEDVLSISTSSLASPLGQRRPKWLSSPHASQGRETHLDTSSDNISSALSINPNPISADPSVRVLQQKLDEVSIQKETIEKYLRAEIDVLKTKVAQQSKGLGSDGIGSAADQSVEALNWKLKATALADENSRLKEEAVVERLRHEKELSHIRDKHAGENS
jgi:hypothetical protein